MTKRQLFLSFIRKTWAYFIMTALVGGIVWQYVQHEREVNAFSSALTVMALQIPPETAGAPKKFDPFAVAAPPHSDLDHYLARGLSHLHEGDLELAEEKFNSAIVIEPSNAIALEGLKQTEKLLKEQRAQAKKRGPAAVRTIFDFATYVTKKAMKHSH